MSLSLIQQKLQLESLSNIPFGLSLSSLTPSILTNMYLHPLPVPCFFGMRPWLIWLRVGMCILKYYDQDKCPVPFKFNDFICSVSIGYSQMLPKLLPHWLGRYLTRSFLGIVTLSMNNPNTSHFVCIQLCCVFQLQIATAQIPKIPNHEFDHHYIHN